MFTNDALIRETLESHRAELENKRKEDPKSSDESDRTCSNDSRSTCQPIRTGRTLRSTRHARPIRGWVGDRQPLQQKPPLRDNIFSGVKIASAYLYIPEHHALQWPSAEDRASLMERISVSALRAGVVIPVLQFGGLEAFATLVEPNAYYVMTAEHPDISMHLSLAYRNPANNALHT